jgi:hypothetical protein
MDVGNRDKLPPRYHPVGEMEYEFTLDDIGDLRTIMSSRFESFAGGRKFNGLIELLRLLKIEGRPVAKDRLYPYMMRVDVSPAKVSDYVRTLGFYGAVLESSLMHLHGYGEGSCYDEKCLEITSKGRAILGFSNSIDEIRKDYFSTMPP